MPISEIFDIKKARDICKHLAELHEENKALDIGIKIDVNPQCETDRVQDTIKTTKDAALLLSDACYEIERLQKAISEPVECFGTPGLIVWNQELTRLLDVPESERGGWPFVLSVGCHLEKFAKSWNSQTMGEQAKEIERLRAESEERRKIGSDAMQAIDRQVKRIQALEAALIEAYAKRIVLDGDCEARTPIKNSLIFKCDKSVTCNWETCPRKDEIFEEAKEKLLEEGKL